MTSQEKDRCRDITLISALTSSMYGRLTGSVELETLHRICIPKKGCRIHFPDEVVQKKHCDLKSLRIDME